MITAVSLFSGAVDGLAIAFQQAGAVVTHHVGFDTWSCRVLARNFPRSTIINKDVRHVTEQDFPAPIDVLFGGPPCQGFSVSGSRLGLADERYLWPEMARIVRAKRPRAVVVENVPGSDSGGLVDAVRDDLENEGYAATAFIFPAAIFGASHERFRVFIVGVVADAQCWRHEYASAVTNAVPDTQRHAAPYQQSRYSVANAAIAGRQAVGYARRAESQKRRARIPQPRLGRAADGAAGRMDGPAVADFPGFPAGQGAHQYDYEPPRVVADKPRDHAARVRALGNAVVWQQAYPIAQTLVRWLEGCGE